MAKLGRLIQALNDDNGCNWVLPSMDTRTRLVLEEQADKLCTDEALEAFAAGEWDDIQELVVMHELYQLNYFLNELFDGEIEGHYTLPPLSVAKRGFEDQQ